MSIKIIFSEEGEGLKEGRKIRILKEEDLEKHLRDEVEKMVAYKAYNYMIGSLRGKLRSGKGEIREHIKEELERVEIYTKMTNLGSLSYYKVASVSRRKELYEEALEKLGVGMDEINSGIEGLKENQRSVIKIDASGLSDLPEVRIKINELLSEFEEAGKKVKSQNHLDGHIALSIDWIRRHLRHNGLYLKAYNKAKDIFKRMIKERYSYNGVVFSWEDIKSMPSFENRIKAYLQLTDIKLMKEIDMEMKNIRHKNGEYRYMYALDDFRYDMGDEN